ncbi:MAG: hypothetical protein ACLGQH_11300 [Acidobacteriota bacterium]
MNWSSFLCSSLTVASLLGLGGPALASTNKDVSVTCRNIPLPECIKSVEGAYSVSIFLNTKLETSNISVEVRHKDALHAVMSVLDTMDTANYAVLAENQGTRYRVTVFNQGASSVSLQASTPLPEEPEDRHRQDGNTVGSTDESAAAPEASAQPEPAAAAAAADKVEEGYVPAGQEGPETVEAAQPEMSIAAYRSPSAGPSVSPAPEEPLAQANPEKPATATPQAEATESPDHGVPDATPS